MSCLKTQHFHDPSARIALGTINNSPMAYASFGGRTSFSDTPTHRQRGPCKGLALELLYHALTAFASDLLRLWFIRTSIDYHILCMDRLPLHIFPCQNSHRTTWYLLAFIEQQQQRFHRTATMSVFIHFISSIYIIRESIALGVTDGRHRRELGVCIRRSDTATVTTRRTWDREEMMLCLSTELGIWFSTIPQRAHS